MAEEGEQGAGPTESKEEKFSRLATKRTKNALDKISLLGNLAGPSYRYTDEQVQKIIVALRQAVDEVEGKFQKRGKKSEQSFGL